MATRADFYIRKSGEMEYMGSIAFDGYEIDEYVLESTTEESFRDNIARFLSERDDSSIPQKDGWPWPWNNSHTTDYSYIFDEGKVWGSYFGHPLYDPLVEMEWEDEDGNELDPQNGDLPKIQNYFPDMSQMKNVKFGGKQSGIMVIGFGSDRSTTII